MRKKMSNNQLKKSNEKSYQKVQKLKNKKIRFDILTFFLNKN